MNIDFGNIANNIRNFVTSYIQLFVDILVFPKATFHSLLESQANEKYKIIKTSKLDERPIVFAGVSLVIGLLLGSSLSIKDAPADVTSGVITTIVVPYLFLWLLYGIAIHFSARLLGGKGGLAQSIAGVLYVLGTLHPLLLVVIFVLSSIFPGFLSYRIALRNIGMYGAVVQQREVSILGFSLSLFYYALSYLLTALYLYFPLSIIHKLSVFKIILLYLVASIGLIGFAFSSIVGIVIIRSLFRV